ncbi:hypothetical protein V8F06_004054 [Rhypophila decipiens]
MLAHSLWFTITLACLAFTVKTFGWLLSEKGDSCRAVESIQGLSIVHARGQSTLGSASRVKNIEQLQQHLPAVLNLISRRVSVDEDSSHKRISLFTRRTVQDCGQSVCRSYEPHGQVWAAEKTTPKVSINMALDSSH